MSSHIHSYIKILLILCSILLICTVLSSCSEKEANKLINNPPIGEALNDIPSPLPSATPVPTPVNLTNDLTRIELNKEFLSNLYDFTDKTSSLIFRSEKQVNQLYAPVNFYLTLSLLSNITTGDAQEEILNKLIVKDVSENQEELLKTISILETQRLNLGRLNINHSLWLSNIYNYHEDLLTSIEDEYRTEIYIGDFSDANFQDDISNWVSKNTNQAFQPFYNNLNVNEYGVPEALISLNTLDFSDEWMKPFDEYDTSKEAFILSKDSEVYCDFMKNEQPSAAFIDRDDSISTIYSLKDNEYMLFILPKEGIEPEAFLSEEGKLSGIITEWTSDSYSMGKVKLWVPKLNYTSKLDLGTIVKEIGIKQIFDVNSNAFSKLVEETFYVGSIKQASKISIDEKGCSAASYTELTAFGAGPSDRNAEIILNHPFIFVLIKEDIPFLVGVVRNPLE